MIEGHVKRSVTQNLKLYVIRFARYVARAISELLISIQLPLKLM